LGVDLLRGKRIRINCPVDEWANMSYTCALDAASDGPMTLQQIGDILGLGTEPIRKIHLRAERKFKERFEHESSDPDWSPGC
jgi:hypothetical protein